MMIIIIQARILFNYITYKYMHIYIGQTIGVMECINLMVIKYALQILHHFISCVYLHVVLYKIVEV